MGKDLRGKDLGVGIYQQKDGYYCARYVNRFGKRKAKRFKKFNMLEFAKENDVLLSNPCKKSVKSDIGKPSDKKEAYLKSRKVNGVSI